MQRLNRLLTWKRARNYSLGVGFIYLFAWCNVLVLGSPPLNSRGEPVGGDYIAFYGAGRLLLDGQAARLYDHDTLALVQQTVLEDRIPGFYDAYRNPPFFALPFVPLALLPLLPSFGVWALLSFACLVAALWLLLDLLPDLKPRWKGLLAIVFAFAPVYFGIIDGENATLSLLLYVLIYRALVRGNEGWAGVFAALGLFKPQLFVIFPLIFLVTGRCRALAAYAVTAVSLALVSFAVVGPDGAVGWLRILVDMETGNATRNAWRMHSLKAFFDLLLPGLPLVAATIFACVTVALILGLSQAWRRLSDLELLFILTSIVAVLVDPHLVDYDLSVLVVAGILAARRLPSSRWVMVGLGAVVAVRMQIAIGDAAIQISVLMLLLGLWQVWTRLWHAPPEATVSTQESRLLVA